MLYCYVHLYADSISHFVFFFPQHFYSFKTSQIDCHFLIVKKKITSDDKTIGMIDFIL